MPVYKLRKLVGLYRAADLADKGGSMVLGLYAAFVAVRNWDVISPSITEMGAIAQDPKVQVASALLDTMAGLNALRGVPNAAVYTQKIGQQVFDRLFKAGSGRFFGAHIAAAQAQTAAQGVSRNLLSYLTLGNFAGAVGIALAGMQAFEGFKADDLAKGYDNTLIAVGGAGCALLRSHRSRRGHRRSVDHCRNPDDILWRRCPDLLGAA
ncbi:hypothetical protein [Tritonibacter mobilis]|uniref:hypothetical protein n=1 Tax=Tritonibacter mobilis TaxID=379347 RepID=UPI001C0901E2|nr:hypothetical protein [Tritonibacter mobilis]MBU3033698.1 hypothetical protein [Tritonibacter mobilis]WHQ84326.1 hypothetical protein OMR53_19415 [Tritonibacter mobilis]